VLISRLYKRKPILILFSLSIISVMLIAGTALKPFPEVIPLPNGFQPEGIASGNGTTFFAGSIPTGAIYRGDLRSGEGDILVPAQEGHMSIGMKFDPRTDLLFVAGGPTGKAFVYNGNTGENVAAIQLTSEPSFINDVVVTNVAAYFTNSSQAEFYRVPLSNNGGLPNPAVSEIVPLSGDFQLVDGFNANGIDATPNGKTLIIVNSALGTIYTVDPESGYASLIDLGGESVVNGDGILLHGKTLYVVQNSFNQISVVGLSSDFSTGSVDHMITSQYFRVPTTIARFGNSLYVVNARFGTPPTADTEYEVVKVSR
jgi:sugar lactone lactonase YvrE